jgi:NAD(P)H dehydrogenase (quinone)
MKTHQPVLVTGGTGATGGYTIDALTKFAVSIRAIVHKDDERAERLRVAGVDVVIGDLLDVDSVRSAMEGISTAYFVYPLVPGLIDATAYFAQAAREAGLKGIVNMSQISARRDSKSHQARDHWISERVFDCSGVRVTHRRPTFFAQWLTYPRVRHGIAEKGLISLPFGNGRHAPIAAEAALAGTASITAVNRDSKRGAGLVALLQQKTQARAALVVTRTDWTSASKLRGGVRRPMEPLKAIHCAAAPMGATSPAS